MRSRKDNPLARAIIVVGAPRSGTSFVGGLLQSVEELAYLNEARLLWRYGNDWRSDALSPEHATPEICQVIRERLEKEVRRRGKTRLVEKTPSNSLRMGFIDRLLPDCLFLHVIRNPVDAVLSLRQHWKHAYGRRLKPGLWGQRWRELRLGQGRHYIAEVARRLLPRALRPLMGPALLGPRLPGMSRMVQEMGVLEVCCLQWRACVEAACQYGSQLPPDRYYEFRLEDLTPPLLGHILDFCQIERRDAAEQFFGSYFDRSRAGAHSPMADPQEVEQIVRWTEPTMLWLGYDRPQTDIKRPHVKRTAVDPTSSSDSGDVHPRHAVAVGA